MNRNLMTFSLCLFCIVGSFTFAEEPVADNGAASSPADTFRSAVRPSLIRKPKKEAAFSAEQDGWIKDNCQFGMPRLQEGFDLGPVRVIPRAGYVLGHSDLSKISYWICEHSVKSEFTGTADRDNSSFKPDPDLNGAPRAELSDYSGSGYDRGHMAPAGDFKFSQAIMDQSFFLSNMVPQYGPTFNRGIWAQLEDTVRLWVKKREECWIVTGPMFYDPLEEDPSTADGLVPYSTVGQNDVAVPTHVYKIVLSKSTTNKWDAIAFVFENKAHAQPFRLHLHRTTTDWIEARTGLNFFSDMENDAELAPINTAIEAQKSAMWETN